MKIYSHLEKGDLTRQLIAAGHLSGNKLGACNDIVMEQGPVNFHTSLIELKGGLTGVVVDLIIGNPSSGRRIHLDLQKFRIEIPWCQVNWLEKAEPLITEARKRPEKTPAPKLYSLPGYPALSFAKNEVLNHRLSRGCVLLPGNQLVGALMGVGERPLLDEFHDRQRFTTCLSVYYERGKRCDLQVDFMVEREPKPGQGSVFERVRRQLLSEQERNPVKLGDDKLLEERLTYLNMWWMRPSATQWRSFASVGLGRSQDRVRERTPEPLPGGVRGAMDSAYRSAK